MKNIVLVGTYPPPYGGVSIFIKRFQHYLKMGGVDVEVFDCLPSKSKKGENILNTSLLKFFFKKSKYNLFHIHSYSAKQKITFAVKAKLSNAKLIISLHSYREKPKGLKKLANVLALKLADEIWVNNTGIAEEIKHDFNIENDRLKVIQHYLHPLPEEIKAINLDYRFETFIKNHGPVLMSSAWKLMDYIGKDLYGFDTCLILIKKLKENFNNVGGVLFIGRNDNAQAYQNLIEQIESLELKDDVLVLDGDKRTPPYLGKVDLFLRCTLSDSFGASVAESLFVGTPVVASNVCPRPMGCYLYEVNNIEDLYQKVKGELEKGKINRDGVKKFDDSLAQILERYNILLS